MNAIHRLFADLEPKLRELTLEEVVSLAGMVLSASHFTLNKELLAGLTEELDKDQVKVLLEYYFKKAGHKHVVS